MTGHWNWTEHMTRERIDALRFEFRAFFGMSPEQIQEGVASCLERVGQEWEEVHGAADPAGFYEASEAVEWSWLNGALREWGFGWPQGVARACVDLGIESVLDFGAGLGEVGLQIWRYAHIPVTFCDLSGRSREFLAWRLGRSLAWNLARPVSPEAVLWRKGRWDAVLCLEVLEHIQDAPRVLAALQARSTKAFCISGVLGRPDNDGDPLHIYRESLLPCFDTKEWALWSGGGLPWWFVRREYARERGLATIKADGSKEETPTCFSTT